MKNILLWSFTLGIVITSCTKKEAKETSNLTISNDTVISVKDTILEKNRTKTKIGKNDTEIYVCPMHNEIKGKAGDKCSKCGMELTIRPSETIDQIN